jgi:fimbrial isopeptide formation D2 family protein/LPXTG-motif cell wall-anchored protein
MKGKIRKLLSVVVATAMTLSCLSVPALAADTTSLQVKSTENFRSYDIYQVFTGTYSGGTETEKLSNVQWGASFSTTELQSKLIVALAATNLPDGSTNPVASNFSSLVTEVDGSYKAISTVTAAQVAEKLTEVEADDNSQEADAIAAIVASCVSGTTAYKSVSGASSTMADGATYVYSFDNIDAGYYLLNETTSQASLKTDKKTYQYSRYMLDVVGGTVNTINQKSDSTSPSIKKEIVKADGTTSQYSNASIGDAVNFKITGTVPDTSRYTTYYYVVCDTLSEGLSLIDDGESGFTVKVGGTEITRGTDYVVKTSGQKFRIVFKSFAGKYNKNDEIEITYQAKLNEKATVGTTGNKNSVELMYSNNPNAILNGSNGDPDDPGEKPTDGNVVSSLTSETYTYTTGFDIYKKDGSGNRLTGASFSITGDTLNTVLVQTDQFTPSKYYDTDMATLSTYWYKTPAGYFESVAPTSNDSKYEKSVVRYSAAEDASATSVTGGYVKKYYIKDDGNVATSYESYSDSVTYNFDSSTYPYYESNYIAYTMSTPTNKIEKTTGNVSYEGTVGDNGELSFYGLSAGTYVIKEIQAPVGYNDLGKDIEITIKWVEPTAGSTECSWEYTYSGDENLIDTSAPGGNIIRLEVINKAGSALPQTGGIGTTIFYVAGTILVLGAAVALITRRRMKGEVK